MVRLMFYDKINKENNMNDNIYIVNKNNFETIKKNVKVDGLDKLCVLADFDKTLTYGVVNGRKTPSMISILRDDDKYLDNDYSRKAHLLAEKYYPIELNPKIDIKLKKKLMKEWWKKHLELLIEKKLNKSHFQQIINDRKVKFRDGLFDVFDFLYEKKIPLIIISASGLGEEPILKFFEKEYKLYPNIHIISNSFIWDNKNTAIGYKKPIIHTLNKDEILLNKFSFYNDLKKRKNILLLGDSFDDVRMADNIKYKNLIKICFLSDQKTENINEYKKIYDVLLFNDSSAEFLNDLLNSFN